MTVDADTHKKKKKANWIQQYIERIKCHDQVGFTSVLQGWFSIHKLIDVIYHVNKLKNQSHMIISIDVKKAFDKIQHLFMIKTFYNLV